MSKNQKKSKQTSKPKVAYYKKDSNFPDKPIVDNSHKYDISSESEEEAPDFNYLLSQQSAAGSHFLLKSEQEKFQGDQHQLSSKHFNIDIKSLNLAIKSIPFYERHMLNDIDWSEEELNQMREEAKVHEEAYKELMKVSDNKVIEQKVEKVKRKVEKLSIDPVKEEEKKSEVEKSPKDEKKSMEKWLDDILDI